MPKFALYYIPPAQHPVYQVGSEILGYDIRRGLRLPEKTPARVRFQHFDLAWVHYAAKYGLHMTTAGTYEYDPDALSMDTVVEACDTLMSCFDPAVPMTLSQHPTEFVWQHGFCGLRYEANPAFQTLHTVLCTYLPRYAATSRPHRRLNDDPAAFDGNAHAAHRVFNFFTVGIFDSFMPHFTLLNPYTGNDPAGIRKTVLAMFGDVTEITVESMCLVRLTDDADFYELVHEFHRADYPQAFEG